MLRIFERTSRKAVAANRKTLVEILDDNADTEFGRRHGFKRLAADPSGRRFRQTVPLTHYRDYTQDVARMESGEGNILTADDLLFFAVSSGTTGATKLVPTTKRHHGFTFKYMGTVVQGVIAEYFLGTGRSERGIDLMSFASEPKLSKGGIPIGSATAEAVRRMARIVPHLWTSPIEIYTVPDQQSARYLHALYGLHSRQSQFVEAVFAPRLLEWLREVEGRWDELVADVRNGTLTDDLVIDEAVRRKVLDDLEANPSRAAELEAATSSGFGGFMERVWPSMTHLMTITSGSFQFYLPALRFYAGSLPIYSPSYGATESFIGVGLWPDQPGHYTMATDPAYFEFIPIGEVDTAQPSTVDMEGVRVGESYELVVTNHAGFYRYRLGDVVRVVGHFGQAPIIEFLYRRGTQFDVTGEKTTEDQMAAAVSRLGETIDDFEIEEYTCSASLDSSPPHYVVYLEPQADFKVADLSEEAVKGWAQALDEFISTANPAIVEYRDAGYLGPPRLVVVEPGSFHRLAVRGPQGDHGPAPTQVKTPRRIVDPEQIELLESAGKISSTLAS